MIESIASYEIGLLMPCLFFNFSISRFGSFGSMKRKQASFSSEENQEKKLKLVLDSQSPVDTTPSKMVDQDNAVNFPMKSFYGNSTKNFTPNQNRPKLNVSSEANKMDKRPIRKRSGSAMKSPVTNKKPAVAVKPVTVAKENSPKKANSPYKKKFFKHRNSSPSKRSRAASGVSVQLHKGFKVQVNLNSKKNSPPKEEKLMDRAVVINSGAKSILDVVDSTSPLPSSQEVTSADSGCNSENAVQSSISDISAESGSIVSDLSASPVKSGSYSSL